MTDVLVCGGRDYQNWRMVQETLDEIHATRKIRIIIEGGASGADELALRWAKHAYVPAVSHFADWANYGKSAGPIRNREMLEWWQPHLVVAFPGRVGTQNMISQARGRGIEVIQIAT